MFEIPTWYISDISQKSLKNNLPSLLSWQQLCQEMNSKCALKNVTLRVYSENRISFYTVYTSNGFIFLTLCFCLSITYLQLDWISLGKILSVTRSELQTDYALLDLHTKSKLRKRLRPECHKSHKWDIIIQVQKVIINKMVMKFYKIKMHENL